MIKIEGRGRAAAPKGSITLAFTYIRNFILLILLQAAGGRIGQIWPNLEEISTTWHLAEIDKYSRIWHNLEECGRFWQSLANFGGIKQV